MKKFKEYILLFCILSIVAIPRIAQAKGLSREPFKDVKIIGYENVGVVCSTFTSQAISFSVAGTTSALEKNYYDVGTASITFTTIYSGLYDGTTYFNYSDTDRDTLVELVAEMNAASTNTLGISGGITASIIQGAFYDTPCSLMSAVVNTDISTAAVVTLSLGSVIGQSYIFPALTATNERGYTLTNGMVNATFASGNPNVFIYNDLTKTSMLAKETISVSGKDGKLNSFDNGTNFYGADNTGMRVDLTFNYSTTTYITDSTILLNGFAE